jgi:hypothetical protein
VKKPNQQTVFEKMFFLLLFLFFSSESQAGNSGRPANTPLPRWTVTERAYDWSPDGKQLAYMTKDSIWVVDTDNFHSFRRLLWKGYCAGGSCSAAQLLWSPNGKRLAFSDTRPGDGWGTIWVVNADGTNVQEILRPGVPVPGAGHRAVAISTWLSNQELAFSVYCGTGCLALYKIDVDTLSLFHFHTCNADGLLTWAPTKQWTVAELHLGALGLIKLTDAQGVSSTTAVADISQCTVSVPGCFPGSVDWEGLSLRPNEWSRDGSQLLYTSHSCKAAMADGPKQFDLHVWDIRTGHQEIIANDAFGGAWSPAGAQIAYLRLELPPYDKQQRIKGTKAVSIEPMLLSVVLMDPATQEKKVISLSDEPKDRQMLIRWAQSPPAPLRWSPNGQYLAVPNIDGTLLLLRKDGSRYRSVVVPRFESFAWSPDSRYLAVRRQETTMESKNREEDALLRFLPPTGKEERSLTTAEIIQRYFTTALTGSLDVNRDVFRGEYLAFVEIQAALLERQGRKGEAQAIVCTELIGDLLAGPGATEQWASSLQTRYVRCPQKGKESARSYLSAPAQSDSPLIETHAGPVPYTQQRAPWAHSAQAIPNDRMRQKHQATQLVPATKPLPSLYIFNVQGQ